MTDEIEKTNFYYILLKGRKMKRKQAKRIKKTFLTKPIIIESLQPSRMEAITNLSLAILETARALNTPAVVVKNSHFVASGKAPSLSIVTKKK